MSPKHFCINLAAENIQNSRERHSKRLWFRTQL